MQVHFSACSSSMANVQFGRQANAQEQRMVAGRTPTQPKPELVFAYDLTQEKLENPDQLRPLEILGLGKEMLADATRALGVLREGLPAQDQPLYVVLKGGFPEEALPERPIEVNLGKEVQNLAKGPVKMLLRGLGLANLPDTTPPPNGYTRADARAAMKALAESPRQFPAAEMLVLMNVLLNRADKSDFIKLDNDHFAFRLTLPGESA